MTIEDVLFFTVALTLSAYFFHYTQGHQD